MALSRHSISKADPTKLSIRMVWLIIKPEKITALLLSYPASMLIVAPGTKVEEELASNLPVLGSPSRIMIFADAIRFTFFSI
ncbi:hypothetical protein D3C87_1585360 [compost metagenome]